jgi:two-component sensor histidine kinase
VCDEGSGPSAGFNHGEGHGLGMKVVDTLARQLKGTLTAQPLPDSRGFCFTVRFQA